MAIPPIDKRKALLLGLSLGSLVYTLPHVEFTTPVVADECCSSDLQCIASTGSGFAYCNYVPYVCQPYEQWGYCSGS
jgi:hypothetical protein